MNLKGSSSNDLWSAYAYGDAVKVVYYKTGHKNCSQIEIPLGIKNTVSDERFCQSLSRTKATIFEIAACNPFEWFCTFTLDAEKADRNNLEAFRKKFSQFIRDENKKRATDEKIKYLIVPEQHKDGAWHLHGLVLGLKEGRDLLKNEFGYLDWLGYRNRFGFFSCSRIHSHIGCSNYISKYVTKNIENANENITDIKSGKHMYFASLGLNRRTTIVHKSAGKCRVKDWDFENEYVKIKWLPLSEIQDSEW